MDDETLRKSVIPAIFKPESILSRFGCVLRGPAVGGNDDSTQTNFAHRIAIGIGIVFSLPSIAGRRRTENRPLGSLPENT